MPPIQPTSWGGWRQKAGCAGWNVDPILIHPYSDEPALAQAAIPCYALVEILAEKIRAVGGQRRFAIARDIYDIHWLMQSGVAPADVIPLLPAKFEVRDLDLAAIDIQKITARHSDFEDDWNRRLSYLVRDARAVDFDEAWETTIKVLKQIEGHVTNSST